MSRRHRPVAVHTPLFTLYSRSINAPSRLYYLWLYAPCIPAVFTLPQRHRPVAVACAVCARAKVACDKARPCARCLRFDKAELCVDTINARRRHSASAAGKNKKNKRFLRFHNADLCVDTRNARRPHSARAAGKKKKASALYETLAVYRSRTVCCLGGDNGQL